MSEINVTSLVDVTMVLLIVFMLTAPLIQAGVNIKLPKTKAPALKPSEDTVVSVQQDGTVFINGDKVEAGKLEAALKTLAVSGEDRVLVRADENVSYGIVMEVIGEVKAAGIDQVGMVTDLKPRS